MLKFEPALVTAFFVAVLSALVAADVVPADLSDPIKGVIVAAVALVGGTIVRARVVPLAD